MPASARGLAYVLAALAGLGVAGAHVIPWSMVPDVIEADEMATGVRREGAYYGFVAFIQKSGTALVLALSQRILHWTGYRPGEEQSASALLAIRLLIGAAPALLLHGARVAIASRQARVRGAERAAAQEACRVRSLTVRGRISARDSPSTFIFAFLSRSVPNPL